MTNFFLSPLKNAHEQRVFASFIRQMADSGALFKAIPQLHGLDQIPQDPRWHPEGDVWTHTLLVIENLPINATFAMSLAALFHDVGKASTTVILETGAIKAHGHEVVSEQLTLVILDSLGADEELKKQVTFIVRHHMMAHSKDTTAKTLQRLIRQAGRELVDQLLQHGVADVAGGSRDFKDCERLRDLFEHMEDIKPEKITQILTGDEIMQITGLEPGPEIGRIMRYLTTLENIDKDEAVKIVKKTNFIT